MASPKLVAVYPSDQRSGRAEARFIHARFGVASPKLVAVYRSDQRRRANCE